MVLDSYRDKRYFVGIVIAVAAIYVLPMTTGIINSVVGESVNAFRWILGMLLVIVAILKFKSIA